MNHRLTAAVGGLAAALALSACNPAGDADKAGAETPAASSRNLADSIAANGDLDSLEALVGAAGLETVLEGVGPYTVFAPADAALQTAGLTGLAGEETRAQGVALLRAHIVPGALTRRDILAAIDANSAGKVEMRTMADGLLSFSKDGDTVVVTAPGGGTARLSGSETVASNGVLQPIDGVLAAAAPPAAAAN